jgi:hypothetical protein
MIGETVGIWSVGNAMGEIRSGIADLSVEKNPSFALDLESGEATQVLEPM